MKVWETFFMLLSFCEFQNCFWSIRHKLTVSWIHIEISLLRHGKIFSHQWFRLCYIIGKLLNNFNVWNALWLNKIWGNPGVYRHPQIAFDHVNRIKRYNKVEKLSRIVLLLWFRDFMDCRLPGTAYRTGTLFFPIWTGQSF